MKGQGLQGSGFWAFRVGEKPGFKVMGLGLFRLSGSWLASLGLGLFFPNPKP